MYYVCMLLKRVRHYDLSVLSMSVMIFQKNWIGGRWVVWALYPVLFLNFFNFAKPLSETRGKIATKAPYRLSNTL